MKPIIRLSQCMIVKNEEKNIRRALSWGKSIVYEQIVVDTGSTDRTVDIAKEMGAKVFCFTWINDFSAAKNFALEQAKGNWIAFLDADEYYMESDVKKIIPILTNAETNFRLNKRPHIVRSALINLNSDGTPISSGAQDRLFKKLPELRFQFKIHESLHLTSGCELFVSDIKSQLTILHTGYTEEAFKGTGKIKRNIALLEESLKECPDNINAWSYLGDSYFADNNMEKTEEIYRFVIDNLNDSVAEERRNAAFCNLLKIKYLQNSEDEEDAVIIYNKSQESNCNSPDAEYWLGCYMFRRENTEAGVAYYELALEKLDRYDGPTMLDIASGLPIVYQILFNTYKSMKSPSSMIKYGVLALRMNRYIVNIIKDILVLLKKERGESDTAQATFSFLMKLYDCTQRKDRIFLYKISKQIPFPALEDRIYELLTSEEKTFLDKKEQSPYRITEKERRETYPSFVCRNEIDQEFLTLINEISKRDFEDLYDKLKDKLNNLQKENENAALNFYKCFSRFPNWGPVDKEHDQYEGVEKRIQFVKSSTGELIWLYCHLVDYQSKKTLISIIRNWLFLETERLQELKICVKDYYDLDLISVAKGFVFVDAGAGTGDMTSSFINTYGDDYNKIYCYEVVKDLAETLQRNYRTYDNIMTQTKALDSENNKALLFIDEEDLSASHLTNEKGSASVNTVTLDSDICEKIDMIKMDINGYEKAALEGSIRHIREEHPILMIALYHRYEDLIEIPKLIHNLDENYKFYLRYYGGDLIPTNYVLYAI